MLLRDTSSASLGSSQASTALSKGQGRLQLFEGNLLPLLHAFTYYYPPILTGVAYCIELIQILGFVLSPHSPAHRITVGIIYMFQFPYWDSMFTNKAITYNAFLFFYWALAVILILVLLLFAVGCYYTHLVVTVVMKLRLYHVVHFLLSIYFVPTFCTLLSSFVCQKWQTMSTEMQNSANAHLLSTTKIGYLVFFADQRCDTTLVKVHMATSILLLVLWGMFSYVFLMTVIPFDRECGSVRSRLNTNVDVAVYIYRVGLVVCFFLTQAYNQPAVNAIVVTLFSFVMMVLYSLYLPFYREWVNRVTVIWFGIVCWCGATLTMTILLPNSQVLVQQNGMYAILLIGCVVMAIAGFFMSGVRYNSATKYLLARLANKDFVPLERNPFAIAALQRNFDLLPYPKGLPRTDADFSPYYFVTKGIIEEALREDAQLASDRLAAEVGEAVSGTTAAEVILAAMVTDGNSEGEPLPVGGHQHAGLTHVLLQEAMRCQVVSPTLGRALFPSDAETCLRFLSEWQLRTYVFPTPYMVYFASRMMNRFMLKYRRSCFVVITYICFLCDYAPGLARMTMCVDMMRTCTRELTLSVTERYLFYHYGLQVRESLGIRNAMHQLLVNEVRRKHQNVLLRTTLVWRNLMEPSSSPVSLFSFTEALALSRWDCHQTYVNSLNTIIDDEELLRSFGLFMEQVYQFNHVGSMCNSAAEIIGRLHLMRLQRAFTDAVGKAEAALSLDEEGNNEKPDALAQEEMDAESELNSAAGSRSTASSFAESSNSTKISSLCTSDGRSSQSKVRNSKRFAAQVVKHVQESVEKSYRALRAHLHWSLFTFSSIAISVVLLGVIVGNGVAAIFIFENFRNFQNMLKGLAYSRTLCDSMLTQLYRTCEMLPTDSAVGLTVDQTTDLVSNITYFRALIDATEAAHNDLFFGSSSTKNPLVFLSMTDIDLYFRVHTASVAYTDVSTSFLTHIPMTLSIARRVATSLLDIPTYQDFVESIDVRTLSENVVITVHSGYDDMIAVVLSSSDSFNFSCIILFVSCITLSVLLVGSVVFFQLWNYRRSASMIAKELYLFTIIPRDSVKRVALETQKRLDGYMSMSRSGPTVAQLDDAPVREISQLDMARSFGVNDHTSSVKLLTHLIERGAITNNQGTPPSVVDNSVGGDAAPIPPTGDSVSLAEEAPSHRVDPTAATVQEQQPKTAALTPRRHNALDDADLVSGVEPPSDLIMEDGAEAVSADEQSLRLLNVFDYAELAKAAPDPQNLVATVVDADDLPSTGGSGGDAGNGAKEAALAEGPEEDSYVKGYSIKRFIGPIIVAFLFTVAGMVFLALAFFAQKELYSSTTKAYDIIACARSVGNATGNAMFLVGRFVSAAQYEDYTLAATAVTDSYITTEKCRSLLIASDFFDLQTVIESFGLIAMSLVATNIIDSKGEAAVPAYAMVANRRWDPFPETVEYAKLLEPYLTPQELLSWAPFSSSDHDKALPSDQRAQLAMQTYLGPFALGMQESMIVAFRDLLQETVRNLSSEVQSRHSTFQMMEIVSVVCWGLAVLAALYMMVGGSKVGVVPTLLILYTIVCAVTTVLGIVAVVHIATFVENYTLWLREGIKMDASVWEFFRLRMYATSFLSIDYQNSLVMVQNMSTVAYMRVVEQALLPQPNAINDLVFFSSYQMMIDTRNDFYHYAWLAMVCAVYGRGQESQYESNPEVSYVRWDFETDDLVNHYKVIWPTDVYLTTFANDVTAHAGDLDAVMVTCRSFMNSRMLRDLSTIATNHYSVLMNELQASYSATLLQNHTRARLVLVTQVILSIIGFLLFLSIFFMLAAASIRAFSQTPEERIIYQVAFGTHVRLLSFAIGLIGVILIGVNICGIFFCRETARMIAVSRSVLSIAYFPSTAMSITMTLASWSEYFSFIIGVERLNTAINKLAMTYREAYFDSSTAVSMRRNQSAILFGTTTPYADLSQMSLMTLRASACVDPTNPTSGDQQPILIQLAVLTDILTAVTRLTPLEIMEHTIIYRYITDALSRLGSLQYTLYSNFEASVGVMDQNFKTYIAVIVVLLHVAALVTILLYAVLLRKVDTAVQQQSIGAKVLLLGLPDDVLNTVPEVKEFYDPDAGSSNDQFKRKLLQSEKLLQNILPPSISRRLKNGERVIADSHASVTVVFASLVGFEEYSHRLDAKQRVHFLNGIVVAFDHIVDLLDLEKIKTVGSIYFFCGGLTKKTERDHAIRCMECSLFFFEALEDHNSRHGTPNIKLCVGINTDPAVAGVIGNKKVAYDLWGDSVNTASRMYSTCIPGKIQVSENTYKKVNQYYSFMDRQVQAKGKGMLPTHVYKSRTKNTAYTELNWRAAND